MRHHSLEYLDSDESDESNEEESEKRGYVSGLIGTRGTVLGGLLHGVDFPVGVTLAGDGWPFDGVGG